MLILNNGTEDHKGDPMHQEANALLKKLSCIDYIGNVEGRDIMAGETPFVLKKHIYACASIAGACLYTFCLEYTDSDLPMLLSALLVVAIRLLASHYRWDLPGIRTDDE